MMPWSSDHPDDRPFAPYAPNPEGPAPRRRPTVAELEARIRHYNSDLDPADPRFRAAVILLAGIEYGHNIDQLARKTGYDRAFVARVARRLIDNGVWKAGVTVVDWSAADEASGTFWNDVAVAEGKMCRRIGPDGRIEWAPAGFWNKNFQFVDPGAEKRLATLYLDPTAPAEEEAPQEPAARLEVTAETASEADAGDAPGTTIIGPFDRPPRPDDGTDRQRPVPDLNDLFGDVVWIG